MNPCQHDYWGEDSFKCNAGKTERKKKTWHKEILGEFSLFVTAYSVKCVDLKKGFIMYDIKYQK